MKQLLFFLLLMTPIALFTQTLQLDTRASTFTWTGKAAFSAYSLSGTLEAKSGFVQFTDDQITAATLTLDMPSMNSEIAQLVKHLKSDDFFEVKKFKTADFVLTSPLHWAKAKTATGNLTIKNVTKPTELVLTKVERKGNTVHLSGIAKVDRTAYGIYYNSPNYFENLKQDAIADVFVLDFELVFR